MVTPRDRLALSFINQFKMVTAKQVAQVAYDDNIKIAYNRLNRLHQDKLIYKTENKINKGFIYSNERIRTLKQYLHRYYRTEFYLKLNQVADIETIIVEETFGSIKPDLLISCIYKNEFYFFSIEVETNANHSAINYNKYNNFFLKEWRKFFEIEPTVIYVTDKNVDDTMIRFKHKHIRTDLSNFNDIFS